MFETANTALLLGKAVFYCTCMQNKSSTSLAIISILAILGVLVIAIDGSEENAARTPFGDKNIKQVQTKTTDQGVETPVEFGIKVENSIEYDGKEVKVEPKIVEPPVKTVVVAPSNSEQLSFEQKQINYANLKAAGLSDFVVKPKPFKGNLFDQFDMSVLSGLDVVEKSVVMTMDGQEKEVISAYEFNFKDKESVGEIYSFLKATIKSELGTTINETNKYGLASFYINFSEPVENAFLVVKMPENVYALSYPKVVTWGIDFQEIISKLLEGLI